MVDNEILFGIVEKKTLEATQGGLILVVSRERGAEAMPSVFTGIQMAVNSWLFRDAHHDRLGPMPGMTIQEQGRTRGELRP